MKTIFLTASILLASLLVSYNHNTQSATGCVCPDHASWAAYCQAYGVDMENPTEEQTNFYLDCWQGSTEEENALNK